MANKRMFTMKIVDSDAFLDMPLSAQCLYFHLNMRADDDGFIGNPKKVMRIIGSNDDDLKLLLAKRFVLSFDNGVIVIKHWRMHNTIGKTRYVETQYTEEKNLLLLKDNQAYSLTSGKPIDDSKTVENYAQKAAEKKDVSPTENKRRTNGEHSVLPDLGIDIDIDLDSDTEVDIDINNNNTSNASTLQNTLKSSNASGILSTDTNDSQEKTIETPEQKTLETAFDSFWEAYPRKAGKQAAKKAFYNARKTRHVTLDVLLSAIEEQKQSRQWQENNGQYIPNPATWLNQGRWEDSLPRQKSMYEEVMSWS